MKQQTIFKKFSELTSSEIKQLQQSQRLRAEKKGRELLDGVRCVRGAPMSFELDDPASRVEIADRSNNAVDSLNNREDTNQRLLKLFKKWEEEDSEND